MNKINNLRIFIKLYWQIKDFLRKFYFKNEKKEKEKIIN